MRRNQHDEVVIKVREATGGAVEYVSGYETKSSIICVRCCKCGREFFRSFHTISINHTAVCPYCVEEERRKKKEIIEKKRQERKAKTAKRKAELERRRARKNIPHICPVCGAITTRQIYCSDKCLSKADHKSHEYKRRARIKGAKVDNNITVFGLFMRDNGICAICGERCDSSDFTMRGDVFIAGNRYPTIDHIIPLSKGGSHSWDNIQLAHKVCNTRKGNKIDVKGIRAEVL